MHRALAEQDHRPWPIPKRPWVWRQSWCDLLFAHWPVRPDLVRSLIPEALELDTINGSAWLSVVPFHMKGVTLRGAPSVPRLSAFPELNLRTYVTADGKPGVWFFSLDATNRIAVWAARRFFHLPYYHARMSIDRMGDRFHYKSKRSGEGDGIFEAEYFPSSDIEPALPGSIDHWLTERYCLYCQTPAGEIKRAEVHHPRWPLQAAEMEVRENSLLDEFGIGADEQPHLLHYSHRLDVVVWPLSDAGA